LKRADERLTSGRQNRSPHGYTSVAYIASVAPTEGGTLVPMSGSGGHMIPASFHGCPLSARQKSGQVFGSLPFCLPPAHLPCGGFLGQLSDSRYVAPRCPVCDQTSEGGRTTRQHGGTSEPPDVGNPNYTPSKLPAKEESAASDRTTTLPRPLAIMPSKAHLLIRRLVV
jgi:hypothetical protein